MKDRIPGAAEEAAPDRVSPAADPRPQLSADSRQVLVIGYGNTLRRDDGAGVRVAELVALDPRLAEDLRRGRVEVLTLYQLTPEVALDMAAASLVVLVDADVGGLPGSVELRELTRPLAAGAPPSLRGPDGRGQPGASSHHVGAGELLALARELAGAAPTAVSVGIGVADLELGDGLSAPVAAAVPRAVDVIVGVIEQYLQG